MLGAVAARAAAHPERDRQTPGVYRAGPLADCLLKKSLQLLDLGFGEEGVEATAEAVELRRPRGDDPGQAVPTGALLRMLAGSLGTHALLLSTVGRQDEAVAALTEVVEVRKRFVAAKEAGRTVSSRG
ncbi:hypothetical protein [Amycolatopsis sp. DG1A-15b]|uniref:hypothetical protein n=1 Tax=Amycolatopsis sp. DG1A-15b TaxID=3052846 RepID=UPI00255BC7A1|nr:hypothetical protein [Amycolatopsis sp. DG1A-15b]WIX90243.1 hypothetical protein QRY02_07335 [Amycolatopsis sp. DG1A-15b]